MSRQQLYEAVGGRGTWTIYSNPGECEDCEECEECIDCVEVENLIPNPLFDGDIDGWVSYGSVLAYDDANSVSVDGTGCLTIVADDNGMGYGDDGHLIPLFGIPIGTPMRLQCRARLAEGADAGAGLQMSVIYYDGEDTEVANGISNANMSTLALRTDMWNYYFIDEATTLAGGQSTRIPTGATHALIQIVGTDDEEAVVFVDEVFFGPWYLPI